MGKPCSYCIDIFICPKLFYLQGVQRDVPLPHISTLGVFGTPCTLQYLFDAEMPKLKYLLCCYAMNLNEIGIRSHYLDAMCNLAIILFDICLLVGGEGL